MTCVNYVVYRSCIARDEGRSGLELHSVRFLQSAENWNVGGDAFIPTMYNFLVIKQ